MGLFSKKSKINKEFKKEVERLETERKEGEKAVQAYREEHKDELQKTIEAVDSVDALIAEERILVSGASRFAIMTECDCVKAAKEVADILSTNPDEIGEKCKEYKPTILILMYDKPDLVAFARKIIELYSSVSILALIAEPDSLTYSPSELKEVHIMGVAKRPCSKEGHAEVLKKLKQIM